MTFLDVICAYLTYWLSTLRALLLDRRFQCPSNKKRKLNVPKTQEELLKILNDSDVDIDDPTFSIEDELRKSGWCESDENEDREDSIDEEEEGENHIEENPIQVLFVNLLPVPQHQTIGQSAAPVSQKGKSPNVTWSDTPPTRIQDHNFLKARQLLIIPNGDNAIDFFNF
ncbi:hypothetical protein FQA39_LY16076 [Lamprigera yunnana]|nr:hypothetical protein FQA39_LY16076 [Lamprigera yunnana]